MIKQAVFLVGGKGERLGELTHDCPKPLLPLSVEKRFIDILMFEAARAGFTDIVLLAGYLGDKVEQLYAGTRVLNSTVRVVREKSALGTGGAVLGAIDWLEDQFLLCNGDSFFDFNLRAFARPLVPGSSARLALRWVEDARRYGTVSIVGNRISGFFEKDENRLGPQLVNGGAYIISKSDLLDFEVPCSIEQDIFPALAIADRLEGAVFEGYFLDIGLPDTFAEAQTEVQQRLNRPIAFLDRDGVLNQDSGYTFRKEDLIWKPEAKEAVRFLNDHGFYVIVVSNQAGVARGYYPPSAIWEFHNQMQSDLAEIGAYLDALYFCPFHPDGELEEYRVDNHPDRKPNPGMILKAFEEWPHDKTRSFLIGDKDSDLAAAERAGIAGRLYQQGSLLNLVKGMVAEASND